MIENSCIVQPFNNPLLCKQQPPFRAPKYTLNDMIDSKCVYPWNEALHNFWGPFENSVNNADESVTQIIRHHQFFVTLILARPANLALFFAEFQLSL